ncbi:MAG: heme o synthase, partial [Chloroflexota bacterium]|nr:heme o synthase [Chloroflexota bacterium]
MSESSHRSLRILLAVTVAATFGLITLGGVVRATESGLGCPDWPLCHGQIIPPFEYHVLIEYSHRLVASVVGALVVACAVLVWWKHRESTGLKRLMAVAVVALAVQVVLGGITVLTAPVVTAHLFAAETLFAMLIVALLIARPAAVRGAGGERHPYFNTVLLMAATSMVILLSGTYIVGSGASTICPSWPLCTSDWLPNFGLQWEHMAHRVIAGVGGLYIIVAAVQARRHKAQSRALAGMGMGAAALVVAQVLAGAANPWFQFDEWVRVLHLSLASALWGHLVAMAVVAARMRPDAAEVAGGGAGDSEATAASAGADGSSLRLVIGDYVALTKPRVMSLLLVTAFGGMVLAAEGLPGAGLIATVILGGALASGGASALNHWLDRDIDQKMERTSTRPVASERVSGRQALVFGLVLNVLAFALLWWGANLLAALLAMAGSVFYVLVYTKWLKRSTAQNIVVGGAAGAVPPLVGWAAVTGGLTLPAFYLFAIIFFWT